ncbi:Scoloptoxin SSD14 [Pseudolycoriella hygida]|uniref:Scoloptoxin SSD14 n=1 Tax=Pseudolycoriella hygida TaxID=35572 RepID=A0A9Q0RWT4_9DIPT|nr:Scoloptoxin SSD14 [Pseudolycoriella hygida]
MKRTIFVVLLFATIAVLIGLGIGLYFGLYIEKPKPPLQQAAVAGGTPECMDLGKSILLQEGSAVDCAVAVVLCEGVTTPQSSGLGGGLIAQVFIKETGTIETLNAREVAPIAATRDMFDDATSSQGGLAIAVPAALKGLYALHSKYGRLDWKHIVLSVAEIADNGFSVSRFLDDTLSGRSELFKSLPLFNETFTNPMTGELYKQGEIMRNHKLANALKIIADEGADAIYGGGSLAQGLVNEIQEAGGIITLEDLRLYEPKWGTPIESRLFNGDRLYSCPLPSTSILVTFVLNILNGYNFQQNSLRYYDGENPIFFHILTEAFKFAFGKRTKLGDELTEDVLNHVAEMASADYSELIRSRIRNDTTFQDIGYYGANSTSVEDHGTAHFSILASNGDAVSITATINSVMGSLVMSGSTGIVFNNEMNDFSIPKPGNTNIPTPANFITPGKSPLSSMTPVLVLDDNNDIKLVLGAAGGYMIPTSVIQVILYYMYFDQSLQTSIDMRRMHHQLQPMTIRHEYDYNPFILKHLSDKGHNLTEAAPLSGFAALAGIGIKNGRIEAAMDQRRGGIVHIF